MRTNYPEPDSLVPLTYSVTHAARRWSVSRTLAYKLVNSGAIRTVKIGPVLRIPTEEVERVAREGTQPEAVAA